MTIALCLKCGETKWGALCACESCSEGPLGPMDSGLLEILGMVGLGRAFHTENPFDMLFSDHYYASESLSEFGACIKEINQHCEDPLLRLCAFLAHVAAEHPSEVMLSPEPPNKERLDSILKRCACPAITLRDPRNWS